MCRELCDGEIKINNRVNEKGNFHERMSETLHENVFCRAEVIEIAIIHSFMCVSSRKDREQAESSVCDVYSSCRIIIIALRTVCF